MPIGPFLAGQGFDPETFANMSAALERVCAALSLNFVDDAATGLVAAEIIALAERGINDEKTLTTMALKKFRPAP